MTHLKRQITYKEDIYMIFYDGMKPLYLETDASGVSLGDRQLHMKTFSTPYFENVN